MHRLDSPFAAGSPSKHQLKWRHFRRRMRTSVVFKLNLWQQALPLDMKTNLNQLGWESLLDRFDSGFGKIVSLWMIWTRLYSTDPPLLKRLCKRTIKLIAIVTTYRSLWGCPFWTGFASQILLRSLSYILIPVASVQPIWKICQLQQRYIFVTNQP